MAEGGDGAKGSAVIVCVPHAPHAPATGDPCLRADAVRLCATLRGEGYDVALLLDDAATADAVKNAVGRLEASPLERRLLFITAPCRRTAGLGECVVLADSVLSDPATWLPLTWVARRQVVLTLTAVVGVGIHDAIARAAATAGDVQPPAGVPAGTLMLLYTATDGASQRVAIPLGNGRGAAASLPTPGGCSYRLLLSFMHRRVPCDVASVASVVDSLLSGELRAPAPRPLNVLLTGVGVGDRLNGNISPHDVTTPLSLSSLSSYAPSWPVAAVPADNAEGSLSVEYAVTGEMRSRTAGVLWAKKELTRCMPPAADKAGLVVLPALAARGTGSEWVVAVWADQAHGVVSSVVRASLTAQLVRCYEAPSGLLAAWGAGDVDAAARDAPPAILHFASDASSRAACATAVLAGPFDVHCVRASLPGQALRRVEDVHRVGPPLAPLPCAKGHVLCVVPQQPDDPPAHTPSPRNPLHLQGPHTPTPLPSIPTLPLGSARAGPVPELSPLEVALARLRGATPQSTPSNTPRQPATTAAATAPPDAPRARPGYTQSPRTRLMESPHGTPTNKPQESDFNDRNASIHTDSNSVLMSTLPLGRGSTVDGILPQSNGSVVSPIEMPLAAVRVPSGNTHLAPPSPNGSPTKPEGALNVTRDRGHRGTVVRNSLDSDVPVASRSAQQAYVDYVRSSFCALEQQGDRSQRVSFAVRCGSVESAPKSDEDPRLEGDASGRLSPSRSILKRSVSPSSQPGDVPPFSTHSSCAGSQAMFSSMRSGSPDSPRASRTNSRLKCLQIRRAQGSVHNLRRQNSQCSTPNHGDAGMPSIRVAQINRRTQPQLPADTSLTTLSTHSSVMSSSRRSEIPPGNGTHVPVATSANAASPRRLSVPVSPHGRWLSQSARSLRRTSEPADVHAQRHLSRVSGGSAPNLCENSGMDWFSTSQASSPNQKGPVERMRMLEGFESVQAAEARDQLINGLQRSTPDHMSTEDGKGDKSDGDIALGTKAFSWSCVKGVDSPRTGQRAQEVSSDTSSSRSMDEIETRFGSQHSQLSSCRPGSPTRRLGRRVRSSPGSPLSTSMPDQLFVGTSRETPFKPSDILPKYGEKGCKLDELKYGDCIVLMSCAADGLLSVCWYGDQCFPVAQCNFGGGRTAKFFEHTVYRIDQTAGADRGGAHGSRGLHKRVPVLFGQPIQLCSIVTGKYLCVRASDDFFDPGYTLNLSPEDEKAFPNTSLHFKFVPSSLLRNDGEKVRLGDTVQLVSLKSAAYVTARPHRPVSGPPNRADLITTTSTSLNQMRDMAVWTINGYYMHSHADLVPETENNAPVPTGVAVLLYHKELEAFLTATGTFQTALRPAKTGKLVPLSKDNKWSTSGSSLNERHTVYFDTSTVPESTSTFVINDFPHSPNALWLVEAIDPTQGGPIKWLQQRQAYRIRHVASGGYLMPTKVNAAQPVLGISPSGDNPHTICVFHAVNSLEGTPEEAAMLMASMCRIQFVHSGLWVHFADMKDVKGGSMSELPSGKRGRVAPHLERTASYNGVFALRPADKAEMERLQCVISLKNTLMNSLNALVHFGDSTTHKGSSSPREERPSVDTTATDNNPFDTSGPGSPRKHIDRGTSFTGTGRRRRSDALASHPPQLSLEKNGEPCTPLPHSMTDMMENTREALTSLIIFCTSVGDNLTDYEKLVWDPFSYTGTVVRERQALLFAENVHLLSLKLLQVPFQLDYDIDSRFVHMFQLCYHLQKEMVRGSPDLAKHLAPYIPFIESHLPHNYHAKQALVEIYSGNEALLSKLTKEQIEGYMLPHPHFELVSSICVCTKNGERVGIQRNQRIVLEALGGIASKIIIRTRAHRGIIWVKPSKQVQLPAAEDTKDKGVRISSGFVISAELAAMRPGVSMRPSAQQERESSSDLWSDSSERHVRARGEQRVSVLSPQSSPRRQRAVTAPLVEAFGEGLHVELGPLSPEDDEMSLDDDDDNEPFSDDETSRAGSLRQSLRNFDPSGLRDEHSPVGRASSSRQALKEFFKTEESSRRDRRRRRAGWIPLKEFIEGEQFTHRGLVKHFEGMLMLWSMLCVDACQETIARVKKAITFEQVLLGILMDYKNPHCDRIRTAYATITRYLYARTLGDACTPVLEASMRERMSGSLRRHSTAKDLDEYITDAPLTTSMSSVSYVDSEDFVLLKWVSRYHLLRNTVLVTECVPRNTFTTKLLKLVQELLRQGVYSPAEVEKTLPYLLHILDPSTDAVDMHSAKKSPYPVDDAALQDAQWVQRRRGRDRRRSGPSKNFGRKSRRATLGTSRDSVFAYSEKLSVVVDAKVEACRTIMMIMDRDGEGEYDFQGWLSKVKIGNREGGDLLAHILLQNTLYEGGSRLYVIALETLYRSLSETLGNGRCGARYTDVGNIDETSITAMAKLLLSYMLKPRKSSNPDRLVRSLLQHLKRSVPNGDSLCVAILRTCTKMIQLVEDVETKDADGKVVTCAMMQDRLNALGLTSDIAMLIDSNNEDVIKRGLDCGIALLEGGNVKIQESLLHFFLSKDDEVFFKSLFDRIENAVFALRTLDGNPLFQRARSFKFGDPDSPMHNAASAKSLRARALAGKALDDFDDSEADDSIDEARTLLYTKEVMRYLQLFCEGHFTPLQNYIRNQGDNVKSYNLVAESLTFLEAVLQAGVLDVYKAEVAYQTFQTLTEYCQGPIMENQSCLIRGGVCICVNAMFIENTSGEERTGVDMNDVREQRPELVDAMRVAAVQTVLSLLEGVVERSNAVVMIGNQGLDLELFREALFECWRQKNQADAMNDPMKLETTIELGFSIFILFRTLQGYFPELGYFTSGSADGERECMRYFSERIGRIEICRSGELERVYFRIPEICILSGLSEKTKTELLWGVRRNTAAEKIIDFFDKGDLLIHDVEYTNTWFITSNDTTFLTLLRFLFVKDKSTLALRSLCRRYEDAMERASVWIAVATNVIIVMCDAMSSVEQHGVAPRVVMLFAWMQVLAMVVLAGAFIYTDAPVLAYKRYKEYVGGLRMKGDAGGGKSQQRNRDAYPPMAATSSPTGLQGVRYALTPSQGFPKLTMETSACVPGSPSGADLDGGGTPRAGGGRDSPDLPDEALGLGDVRTLSELFETFKGLEDAPHDDEEATSDFSPSQYTESIPASPASSRLSRLPSTQPNTAEALAAATKPPSQAPSPKRPSVLAAASRHAVGLASCAQEGLTAVGSCVAQLSVPIDPNVHHNLAVLRTCLTTAAFYQHFIMLWIALAGIFVNPLVLSLNLFLMIRASPVLLNVIRAITQNGKALLLTSVLGIVVIYLFSVVAYIKFSDSFDSPLGEKVCRTLWSCFVFNLAYGIRSGGGIGDHMTDPTVSSQHYGEQMLFEFLFFVVVIVILLNIIFGIIIDTFAELRAQRQSVEEDIHSKCFICGLEASEFDRHADGFQHHIKQDHNMWLYIFFLHHLRLKDPSDFTGQESFVNEQVSAADLSFFPMNKALALDNKEKNKSHEEGETVEKSRDSGDVMRTLQDLDTKLFEGLSVNATGLHEVRNQFGEITRTVKDLTTSMDRLKASIEEEVPNDEQLVMPLRSGVSFLYR